MGDDRRCYRTTPGSDLDLELAVLGSGGRLSPAELVDISGGGLRVRLPLDLHPAPQLGTVLQLQFTSRLLLAPIVTPAVVLRTEDDSFRPITGLQFLDWLGLTSAVPTELMSVFNLRSDQRLELDPQKPTPVAVKAIERRVEVFGVLRDISRGGLSFCTGLSDARAFASSSKVGLSFSLPQLDAPLALMGMIRHRHLLGGSVHFGVCFDPMFAANFGQQERIAEYVSARMRQAIEQVAKVW